MGRNSSSTNLLHTIILIKAWLLTGLRPREGISCCREDGEYQLFYKSPPHHYPNQGLASRRPAASRRNILLQRRWRVPALLQISSTPLSSSRLGYSQACGLEKEYLAAEKMASISSSTNLLHTMILIKDWLLASLRRREGISCCREDGEYQLFYKSPPHHYPHQGLATRRPAASRRNILLQSTSSSCKLLNTVTLNNINTQRAEVEGDHSEILFGTLSFTNIMAQHNTWMYALYGSTLAGHLPNARLVRPLYSIRKKIWNFLAMFFMKKNVIVRSHFSLTGGNWV